MYQKLLDPMTGEISQHCIRRISDRAIIPGDPMNSDWQAYLLWCKEGNSAADPDPLPVDNSSSPE